MRGARSGLESTPSSVTSRRRSGRAWPRLGRTSSARAAANRRQRGSAGKVRRGDRQRRDQQRDTERGGPQQAPGEPNVAQQRQMIPEPERARHHEQSRGRRDRGEHRRLDAPGAEGSRRRHLQSQGEQEQLGPAEREAHAIAVAGNRQAVPPAGDDELLRIDEVVGVVEVSLEEPIDAGELHLEEPREPDRRRQRQTEQRCRRPARRAVAMTATARPERRRSRPSPA